MVDSTADPLEHQWVDLTVAQRAEWRGLPRVVPWGCPKAAYSAGRTAGHLAVQLDYLTADSWAIRKAEQWAVPTVGNSVDWWEMQMAVHLAKPRVERTVVPMVGLWAGLKAARSADDLVELTGKQKVEQLADNWADRRDLQRVGSTVGKMAAVKAVPSETKSVAWKVQRSVVQMVAWMVVHWAADWVGQ